MEKRNICKCAPYCCTSTSTHLEDRAQLAYGWFALPKLLKELDSDVRLTHWKAVVSLTEFLLNPLNAQRAITEMDIVRKWVSNSGNYRQSIKFSFLTGWKMPLCVWDWSFTRRNIGRGRCIWRFIVIWGFFKCVRAILNFLVFEHRHTLPEFRWSWEYCQPQVSEDRVL